MDGDGFKEGAKEWLKDKCENTKVLVFNPEEFEAWMNNDMPVKMLKPIWLLLVFGITHGFSTGSLFTPIWKWCETRDWFIINKIGELFSCHKCLGFWVGGFVSTCIVPGPASLLILNNPCWVVLGDMFVASAVCWLLCNWGNRYCSV